MLRLCYAHKRCAERTRRLLTFLPNPIIVYQTFLLYTGIYATGPFAHLFHGVVEQSYIFHVMDYALCLTRSKEELCTKPPERGGPTSHGPTSHGPTSHGPTSHGPTSHGVNVLFSVYLLILSLAAITHIQS